MSKDRKTLMEIGSFMSAAGGARQILTVELDGSITYSEPLTQAELKGALEYVNNNRMHDSLTAQILLSMVCASELARLNHENTKLKLRLTSAPTWCPGCGRETGSGIHVCGGKGGLSS